MFGILSILFGILLILVGLGQLLTDQLNIILVFVGAILWAGGVYVLITDYVRQRDFKQRKHQAIEHLESVRSQYQYPDPNVSIDKEVLTLIVKRIKEKTLAQSEPMRQLNTKFSNTIAPRSVFDRLLGKPKELEAYVQFKKVYQSITQATIEALDLKSSDTYVTVLQSTIEPLSKGTYRFHKLDDDWVFTPLGASVRYIYDALPPALLFDANLERDPVIFKAEERLEQNPIKHTKYGAVYGIHTLFFDATFNFEKPTPDFEDNQAMKLRLQDGRMAIFLVKDLKSYESVVK